MEKMIRDLSCVAFTEELFSKKPVPGGGGAAALVGALGVSLCAMAGNLTVGKKKYADVEAEVNAMIERAEMLRNKLLELIDKDAEAFEPLSKAYSMPKDAPGYKENMYKVTIQACRAPYEMMKCCCEAIDIIEEMAEKCSRLMVSDVGCAAYCAKAALESASLNIFVNTGMFRGDNEADRLENEAKTMLEVYCKKAQSIADEISNGLMN